MFYCISHILSGKLAKADQNLIQPEGLLTTDRVPHMPYPKQKTMQTRCLKTAKFDPKNHFGPNIGLSGPFGAMPNKKCERWLVVF